MKNQLIWGLFLASVGVALLQDPKCRRGCRTVAEHLLSHGIEDFIKGFAA